MPKEYTYHVGLLIDYSKKDPKTVIMQLRRDIDYLDCELWEYLGQRITTKKKVKENKNHLLAWIYGYFKKEFTKIIID